MTDTIKITVSIDSHINDSLNKLAADKNISKAALVRKLLSEYVDFHNNLNNRNIDPRKAKKLNRKHSK